MYRLSIDYNFSRVVYPVSRKGLFIGFLLLISGGVRAQKSEAIRQPRSYYVENLTGRINVTPFIYGASNRFMFTGGKRNIEYSPNEAPSIGIRLQYKWLGGAITYGPKNIQAEQRGTSTYTNILLNSYSKKFGFDVYYVKNKGYYVSNQLAREELKAGLPYPLRPDLETSNMGLNLYYVFNHRRFSYRSSFMQNEIQKHTAGSFLLTLTGSVYALNADSSIVSDIYKSSVAVASQIRTGKFYNLGVMPGYAFTLVALQRFYFTLSLSYGLVVQSQNYAAEDRDSSVDVRRTTTLTRGLVRTSIGFNSRYFYTGLSAVGDNYHVPLGAGNHLEYSVGNVQLFIGTRLAFPKRYQGISDAMDRVPLLSEKVESQ